MNTKKFIEIQKICSKYKIPESFICALHDYKLIDVISVRNIACIHEAQIKNIEKMMRLHYDLDINFDRMDIISNLLKKVESLIDDIGELQNRLRRFDDPM